MCHASKGHAPVCQELNLECFAADLTEVHGSIKKTAALYTNVIWVCVRICYTQWNSVYNENAPLTTSSCEVIHTQHPASYMNPQSRPEVLPSYPSVNDAHLHRPPEEPRCCSGDQSRACWELCWDSHLPSSHEGEYVLTLPLCCGAYQNFNV